MEETKSSQVSWRPVNGRAELTLIVDTPRGLFMRRIPDALPLPADVEPGPGAEMATHTAAATWGLPDFVFVPALAQKGSGRRELGDRILIAGRRAAVVQVKSRTVAPKAEDAERAWINKVAGKAVRQAKGTVRMLRLAEAEFVNGRGRTLTVRGQDYEWIAVVVLDHHQVPAGTVACWEDPGMPAIAVTRRDWDFLFDQLRSTTAVLDYLFRAAGQPQAALDDEPVRYYELAAADAAAAPGSVDTTLVGEGGRLWSSPLLPQVPAGRDDTHAHLMTRILLEDIARSPLPAYATEADRHLMLSDLDRLPVSARTEWGQLLLEMLDDVPNVAQDEHKWRFRRQVDSDGRRQLILGCTTRFSELVQRAFSGYVQLRQHEAVERTGDPENVSTLGVLLTPRTDGLRPWDTTAVRVSGPSDLSPEELEGYRSLWNGTFEDGRVRFPAPPASTP
ncbi:hypothetical protein [Kitasatospora purpeofusca]|uniref:hypothetical protein n=1 Tax=Kitasatospora purpeofusca TaxID=67352 RepID=UPI003821F877